MSVHRTDWEDGSMAGVRCDGTYVGTITSYEDEPWICDKCGASLRLVWDVRIEEVPRTAPEQMQQPVNSKSIDA